MGKSDFIKIVDYIDTLDLPELKRDHLVYMISDGLLSKDKTISVRISDSELLVFDTFNRISDITPSDALRYIFLLGCYIVNSDDFVRGSKVDFITTVEDDQYAIRIDPLDKDTRIVKYRCTSEHHRMLKITCDDHSVTYKDIFTTGINFCMITIFILRYCDDPDSESLFMLEDKLVDHLFKSKYFDSNWLDITSWIEDNIDPNELDGYNLYQFSLLLAKRLFPSD